MANSASRLAEISAGFGSPPIFSGVGGRLPGPTAADDDAEQHDDEHNDDEHNVERVSNRFLFLNLLLSFLFDLTTKSPMGTENVSSSSSMLNELWMAIGGASASTASDRR